jgi:hypothetical protein
MNRRAQFTGFLGHKVRELQYALTQLVDACDQSLASVQSGVDSPDGNSLVVTYHFSSIAAQLQTIKDILPVLLNRKVTWTELSTVRHLPFIQSARNAITHDGNPVINLWVEGRYFVASAFVRQDQNGQPVSVTPPTSDVRTIALEFAQDLALNLIQLLEQLKSDLEVALPIFGQAFFDAGMQHPAIPAFAKELYASATKDAAELSDAQRVDKLQAELQTLRSFCATRLAND